MSRPSANASSPTASVDLAIAAARAADDKGATEVMVLDVGDVLGICGYFVIASASNTLVAHGRNTGEQLAERFGEKPRSVEGATDRRWVLLDYADIVVHVFHTEERDYYRIERLYSDAEQIDWQA